YQSLYCASKQQHEIFADNHEYTIPGDCWGIRPSKPTRAVCRAPASSGTISRRSRPTLQP
ncbi:MAG: hypothetical protein Q4B12_08555, partial [Bowdeniella nasicola]|nr:hypothetical protein [Bowdeniella nasicola]